MERNMNNLIGLKVGAVDGEIGKVADFYFDDKTWTIRYLVVHTGSWLFGRKVLISTSVLEKQFWQTGVFPVNLTMEQIGNSPDIDMQSPVTRKHEIELQGYYQWQNYWATSMLGGNIWETNIQVPNIPEESKEQHEEPPPKADSSGARLRSAMQVMGYRLHATDEEIGYVDDYLVDDDSWQIHFLVLDIRKWLDSRKVLIPSSRIREVGWENNEIFADLSSEAIRNSPEHI